MVTQLVMMMVTLTWAAGAWGWAVTRDTSCVTRPTDGSTVADPDQEGCLMVVDNKRTLYNNLSDPHSGREVVYAHQDEADGSVEEKVFVGPPTREMWRLKRPGGESSQRKMWSGPTASVRVRSEARWLSQVMVSVVRREMKQCDLVVAYDDGYRDLVVVEDLLQLPNPRQVVNVRTTDDLLWVVWVSLGCRAYLFLLDDPGPLLTFVNIHDDHWHYHGRYVFVGLNIQQLEDLAVSKKGKKTEHLVGAVKSSNEGEWFFYMNLLYWGRGIERIATWRRDKFTSQVDLFPDKLSDLRGAVLKVLTFVWEPSIFYFRTENGTLLFRYGVDIDLTKTLSHVLNFTIQFEEPPNDERWGRLTENGSFTGLLGQVNRSQADVGVANLYVPQRQVNIIEYSAPYDTESSCFLVRSEPPLPRWQALAFPFQKWTWLAILACLVTSGPLLYLLVLAAATCGQELVRLQTLTSTCYYTFAMHFSEPQIQVPQMTSTRVFVMFLWLYTMILTIAYSTNLTAFMVVSKQPATINTIKELHDSDLTVVEIGTFYEHQLASASDPYLQGLTKKFARYKTPEEIFSLILEGKVAYLHNRGYQEFVKANKLSSRGVSRVRIMKECFAPYNIAMGLQRHSPLKRRFDQVIGWIQQSGMIRHFFIQSLRRAASTKEYSGDAGDVMMSLAGEGGVMALTLHHLQGIFLVLVIFWIISLIVFLMEKTFSK
ncbi:glutamate receptor U1-like isoform X2 [Panulirus ornatus]